MSRSCTPFAAFWPAPSCFQGSSIVLSVAPCCRACPRMVPSKEQTSSINSCRVGTSRVAVISFKQFNFACAQYRTTLTSQEWSRIVHLQKALAGSFQRRLQELKATSSIAFMVGCRLNFKLKICSTGLASASLAHSAAPR